MKRFRFTIGQAMATVLFVGIGFAAMKNPNILWSSATYTLAILMISVASLVAIARQGRSRLPWAGFALFGGFALLAGALPVLNAGVNHPPSPMLLTRQAFLWLLPYVSDPGDYPAAWRGKVVYWPPVCRPLAPFRLGHPAAVGLRPDWRLPRA
jgi:hypothetical protein